MIVKIINHEEKEMEACDVTYLLVISFLAEKITGN